MVANDEDLSDDDSYSLNETPQSTNSRLSGLKYSGSLHANGPLKNDGPKVTFQEQVGELYSASFVSLFICSKDLMIVDRLCFTPFNS
jgi:hypothetical protein